MRSLKITYSLDVRTAGLAQELFSKQKPRLLSTGIEEQLIVQELTMVKTCENCGIEDLKCIKCIEAGAFGDDAKSAIPHTGECVYEHCKRCERKARAEFLKAQE